ncbi:MAG TPA: TonB C-terminal domain-containing protein, partial [Paracoccus sp. (in: a-proteobacteria)]|nr:TonB C-terminal domain-containing protein [Paracoccus sp. (in: a-proteobacteria)]
PPPPDAVVLQKPARPKERPEPPKEELAEAPREKTPEKEPEPRKTREKKAPEVQPSRKATTELKAARGERTAAPQAQAGAPSKKQVANWHSKVNAAVARHMKRAQSRLSGRGSVTVNIRFSIDPSGQISGARLAGSTGNAKNDSVLSSQIARLPRMPAPPSGKSTPMVLPVLLELR